MQKSRKKAVKKNHEAKHALPIDAGRKYEFIGIILVTAGIISLLGLSGLNVGFVGIYFAKILRYLFGAGVYPISCLLLLLGWQYIIKHQSIVYSKKFFGILGVFVIILAIYHHFTIMPGQEIMPDSLPIGGGLAGGIVLLCLRLLFGIDGSIIILFAGLIGSVLLATTWSLRSGILKTKAQAAEGLSNAKEGMGYAYKQVCAAEEKVQNKIKEHKLKASFYNQEKDTWTLPEKEADLERPTTIKDEKEKNIKSEAAEEDQQLDFTIEYSDNENQQKAISKSNNIEGNLLPLMEQIAPKDMGEHDDKIKKTCAEQEGNPYQMPDLKNILFKSSKRKNSRLEKEISDKAHVLAETLENFKVQAKIINACHGPAITRYELALAPGVKVSKITNLADDLALSLAAFSVRIEPIPGKAAIGIEVPNKELESVQLREVLEADEFLAAKSKLTVGLGMDIGGKAIFADLAKMPHLLVAGATGSGKSVCINTLITSILFKAAPDEVKFILIDPKMVELSNYNDIPHLMVPVVTDAQKAASVLRWAVLEMEKRYANFARNGVRDMTRFNKLALDEKMPALVIIIDELADLMMVAPHDVEDAICRLAQKARAAGIHLVLATQRPSVDVITGIIKANIPSRISFAVSSQIDSRTILDMSGAEKLLGKGDMLFYPVGSSKPQRVQGAFISDEEVERLLEFIKSQGQTMEENQEIMDFAAQDAEKDKKDKNSGVSVPKQDELLQAAVETVINAGQASTSSIQRHFRIGYTRAARLIDTMEDLHIIGASAGSKPRDILMNNAQAMEVLQKLS